MRFKQIYLFENVSVEVIGAHDWAFVLAEKRLLDMEGVPKKNNCGARFVFLGGKKIFICRAFIKKALTGPFSNWVSAPIHNMNSQRHNFSGFQVIFSSKDHVTKKPKIITLLVKIRNTFFVF